MVIRISFGVIIWVVFSDIVISLCGDLFSDIVISLCGDLPCLLIVIVSCGVTLVLFTANVEICTPGLFFRWGFDI